MNHPECLVDYPLYIKELNSRQGRSWSERDIDQVRQWWCQKSQLRLVWFYAARYLGRGTTHEDVEDAVVEFFDKLEEARQHYTPGGPDFATFLLHVCYKNHCIRKGETIRRALARELSGAERICLEIRDERPVSDPQRMTQGMAFLAAIDEFAAHAKVGAKERDAFILRYIDGLSYEEIAAAMDAPIGSVKGWLHRATKAAREFLIERGWS